MNINKRHSKLKDWGFKMPTLSYCQTVIKTCSYITIEARETRRVHFSFCLNH